MGWFVYFAGHFDCVRCGKRTSSCFQTKLLRSDEENTCREYASGDAEIIDGLDDFRPLHPWDGGSPLVVAAGDWDCSQCGLTPQWARVVFDIAQIDGAMYGTIREISTLQPTVRALDSVHFVEWRLAQLTDFWQYGPAYDWRAGCERWNAESVESRCRSLDEGYRTWCRDVAGVLLPEE